jgi:pimeloyl-ACP methyl ester carboxylesterase
VISTVHFSELNRGCVGWAGRADRNPDRIAGVVVVDSLPVGLTGESGRERIQKLFRRWRLLFPIASRLGLAARMTADQHAEAAVARLFVRWAHALLAHNFAVWR